VNIINELTKKVDIQNFKNLIKIPPKNTNSQAVEDVKTVFKKIKGNQTRPTDLFKICDHLGGKTGSIAQNDFGTLARRLGIPLTEHRVQEIFAGIKGAAISIENMELDEEEFVKALGYLKEKQLIQALQMLGVTPQILYATLAYLLFLLMILIAFIFMGIKAFTVGGTFSAVINSLLPALGATSISGKDKADDKVKSEHVEKACKESMDVIQAHKDK